MNARLRAFARPGHIDDADSIVRNPLLNLLDVRFVSQIDNKHGLAIPDR